MLEIKNTVVARAGIYHYRIGDKWIAVLRPEEEVEKSAPAFNGVPLTLEHPASREVTDDNRESVSKGLVQDSRYDDGLHRASLQITDAETEKAVRNKTHRYVSAGYSASVVKESGVWVDSKGIHGTIGAKYKYTHVQQDIVPNHISLVSQPRAGSLTQISLDAIEEGSDRLILNDSIQTPIDVVNDSAEEIESDDQTLVNDNQTLDSTTKNPNKEKLMQIIHNDSVFTLEGENAQEVKNLIDGLKSDLSETQESLSSKQTELDSISKEKEGLQGQLDSLKVEKQELETKLEEAQKVQANDNIEARLQLWSLVGDSIEKDYSLSEQEIKVAYLSKQYPELAEKLTDASEAYVDGLFEGLKPSSEKQETVVDAYKGASKNKKEMKRSIKRDGKLPHEKQ